MTDANKLAIDALQESQEFFQSYSVGAMSRNNAESMAIEALEKVVPALAALSAQPDYAALEKEHLGDPDLKTGIYAQPVGMVQVPRAMAQWAIDYIENVPDDRYQAEHIDKPELLEALRKSMELPRQEQPAQPDHSELVKYARLGKVAMRFVDRAGDVHPGIDDAETICAEFYKAMSDALMLEAIQ